MIIRCADLHAKLGLQEPLTPKQLQELVELALIEIKPSAIASVIYNVSGVNWEEEFDRVLEGCKLDENENRDDLLLDIQECIIDVVHGYAGHRNAWLVYSVSATPTGVVITPLDDYRVLEWEAGRGKPTATDDDDDFINSDFKQVTEFEGPGPSGDVPCRARFETFTVPMVDRTPVSNGVDNQRTLTEHTAFHSTAKGLTEALRDYSAQINQPDCVWGPMPKIWHTETETDVPFIVAPEKGDSLVILGPFGLAGPCTPLRLQAGQVVELRRVPLPKGLEPKDATYEEYPVRLFIETDPEQ